MDAIATACLLLVSFGLSSRTVLYIRPVFFVDIFQNFVNHILRMSYVSLCLCVKVMVILLDGLPFVPFSCVFFSLFERLKIGSKIPAAGYNSTFQICGTDLRLNFFFYSVPSFFSVKKKREPLQTKYTQIAWIIDLKFIRWEMMRTVF